MVILEEIKSEPTPEANNGRASEKLHTTDEQIKVFRRPYAHQLMNNRVNGLCSECFKEPEVIGKLNCCSGCNFVQYCGKDCQKMAWPLHKAECSRLQQAFPNLPLTDVLYLSKILDRKQQIAADGDRFGFEEARKFEDLEAHVEEVRRDEEKMKRFNKVYEKIKLFRNEDLKEDEFFKIFCQAAVNSLTVHSLRGEEVGITLDLYVSRYNHSCRPNCSILFDGYFILLRPMTPDIDTNDPSKATISYIEVGQSRYQRRKELKTKWYFDCHCERCEDPSDNLMTSIRCTNILCDAPIPITEDEEPKPIKCPKCKSEVGTEYISRAQKTMMELPAQYQKDVKIDELKGYLEKARPILHEKNVYLNRLETVIAQLSGKLGDNVASLYSKVQQTFSACFPTTDAKKPFNLIRQVATLIKEGSRKEALPFAFDAMCILEATQGLAHPNYLKVLALWTFLDKGIEKTDDELLALTELDETESAKSVDITSLLSGMKM